MRVASSYLNQESVVVKMATALMCCGRLHDPFSRTACYVSAGISNKGFGEGEFLIMDTRAIRYERMRRTMMKMAT